jgi:hypothetical protein
MSRLSCMLTRLHIEGPKVFPRVTNVETKRSDIISNKLQRRWGMKKAHV